MGCDFWPSRLALERLVEKDAFLGRTRIFLTTVGVRSTRAWIPLLSLCRLRMRL